MLNKPKRTQFLGRRNLLISFRLIRIHYWIPLGFRIHHFLVIDIWLSVFVFLYFLYCFDGFGRQQKVKATQILLFFLHSQFEHRIFLDGRHFLAKCYATNWSGGASRDGLFFLSDFFIGRIFQDTQHEPRPYRLHLLRFHRWLYRNSWLEFVAIRILIIICLNWRCFRKQTAIDLLVWNLGRFVGWYPNRLFLWRSNYFPFLKRCVPSLLFWQRYINIEIGITFNPPGLIVLKTRVRPSFIRTQGIRQGRAKCSILIRSDSLLFLALFLQVE